MDLFKVPTCSSTGPASMLYVVGYNHCISVIPPKRFSGCSYRRTHRLRHPCTTEASNGPQSHHQCYMSHMSCQTKEKAMLTSTWGCYCYLFSFHEFESLARRLRGCQLIRHAEEPLYIVECSEPDPDVRSLRFTSSLKKDRLGAKLF